MTGFIARSGIEGLRLGPEVLTLGLRGIVQGTLHLEGARVHADDVLGAPGSGLQVADDTLSYGRLGSAALNLSTDLQPSDVARVGAAALDGSLQLT